MASILESSNFKTDAQVARAYEPREKQKTASYSLKVTLVAMDCVFLGLQPVLVHLSKNSKGTYSFSPLAVNFMVELAKTTFALITLLILGTGRPGPPMYRSLRSFIIDAHHNKLLAVPALFYAINNLLKFKMQLLFHPVTTKMLGNLKVFTIALLMRVIMKRQFNIIQWEALFLLVAGITVNQLSSGSCASIGKAAAAAASSHALDQAMPPLIPAILCTLGTVTVPSAASVYNEFALKRHMDTSVHLQNFFLYFYGMMFNLVAVLVSCLYQGTSLSTMFANQSWVTLLLIANNAAQGILSSFFYKFADTILKKYSSTIATIFTAVMSWQLFGHAITVNFLLGVSIVFISMHQFFTFGDKNHKPSIGDAASMRNAKMLYSPSLEQIALAQAPGTHSNGYVGKGPDTPGMHGTSRLGAGYAGREDGRFVGGNVSHTGQGIHVVPVPAGSHPSMTLSARGSASSTPGYGSEHVPISPTTLIPTSPASDRLKTHASGKNRFQA